MTTARVPGVCDVCVDPRSMVPRSSLLHVEAARRAQYHRTGRICPCSTDERSVGHTGWESLSFSCFVKSKDTPPGWAMAEGFKRDRDTPQLRSGWERWDKTGTAGQH